MRHLSLTFALIILWASSCWAMSPAFLAAVTSGRASTGTLIFDDTLYEGATVGLASHTVSPGPGGVWSNTDGNSMNVGTTGAVKASSGGLSFARNATSTALGAAWRVVVIASPGVSGTNTEVGPAAFESSDIDGYIVSLNGDGAAYLIKITGGSTAIIGSSITCSPFTATDTYEITLIHTSGYYSFTVKNTTSGSVVGTFSPVAESTHTPTKPGMYEFNTSAYINDIKAYND